MTDKQTTILAKAPSNIALIKYMGKLSEKENTAANSSLSYTLNHLTSSVLIKKTVKKKDSWAPLDSKIKLQKKAQDRFLKHWLYLKKYFKITGYYKICSSNNFPSSCGLASSASSFAALTKAAYQMHLSNGGAKLQLTNLAKLSQIGSGSSCRSLFSPWAQWHKNSSKLLKVHKNYAKLKHNVLIISDKKKVISSSQAHKRVLKHTDFKKRLQRSEKRFIDVKKLLLKAGSFLKIQNIVWDEFIDMHNLFESCPQSFSYFNLNVKAILKDLKIFIANKQIWLSMDAGPNIHFLYSDKEEKNLKIHLSKVIKKYKLKNLI